MGNSTKISTKIWRPILENLEKRIEAACLRRDAYLSAVLSVELDYLDAEAPISNSQDALSFISESLDKLDRKLVSFTLDAELVVRLNSICAKKRINRDSFFNRLLLVLAASPKHIDRLYFPLDSEWRNEVWTEYRSEGPFFQNSFNPLDQEINPFWAIRAGIELYSSGSDLVDYIVPDSGITIKMTTSFDGLLEPADSFYTRLFHDKNFKDINLYGLNVFIPNWQIPEHELALEHARNLDTLLGEL